MLLEIQIPVLEQFLRNALPRQPLAVVGLKLKLSVVPKTQVVKVTTYRAKVLAASTEHFDHDFRVTSDRPLDVLNLRREQPVRMPRSPPRVGGDVQEGNAHSNINGLFRHIPDPNSLYSPPATPSRDRAARSRPATWPAARRDRDPLPADPGSSPGRSGSSSARLLRALPRHSSTRAVPASAAATGFAGGSAPTRRRTWPRASHVLPRAHSASADLLGPTLRKAACHEEILAAPVRTIQRRRTSAEPLPATA